MEKKNYGLFKIIGITFLFYVLLTWFIPVGGYSQGEFVKGDVSPVGLYGLFSSPVYSFAVFIQYFVLILCIGGFYGVLNKTLVYQRIVSFFSKRNKTGFLIACILINALLVSLFGEVMVVFILLPFFTSVLLKLGYDKLTSIASTVGASLVGGIASICGNLALYKNYFNLSGNTSLVFNIILFVILIFLFTLFVIASSKKNKNIDSNVSIPLYVDKKNTKKSIVPFCIIITLSILLIVLGLYNWYHTFNIEIFNTIHEKLTTLELFGIPIISRVFGEFNAIGFFTNYDLSAILVIASCVIAWVYSIKFNDLIDGFKEGAKEMLLPGVYVVFASLIFSCIATSNSGNISLTISNSILNLFKDFNIFTGALTSICGSLFYNDFLYFVYDLHSNLSLYSASMMPVILGLFQSVFGVMMFILPVSVSLIFGLKYLNISYKDWIKYIWKFLLQAFIISLLACVIFSMLV